MDEKVTILFDNDGFKLIYMGEPDDIKNTDIINIMLVLFLMVHINILDKVGYTETISTANETAYQMVEMLKDYISERK